MASATPEAGWSAAAFGLALSGTGAPPTGLGAGAANPAGDLPAVTLVTGVRRDIEAAWPRRGARRIATLRPEGARRAALTIDVHPDAGHRFAGVGYGLCVASADASRVTCAPASPRWARYLHGQVLPVVAGIHGRELLHAAGLVVPGVGAVAVSGPSGMGKTTLSGALRDAGATFLSDDVVSLVLGDDGSAVAHPGPAARAVVHPDGGETFESVPAVAPATPLAVVCILRRSAGHRRIAIEDLDPGDPRLLMGCTYEAVRREPARLVHQLDVFAAIVAGSRVIALNAPLTASPARLASTLLEAIS